MAHKNRTPLQVSDEFLIKLKDLQKKIRMKTGDEKSLRELTKHLANSNIFNEVEKIMEKKGMDIDVKIKFDRRKFQ